MPEISRFLGIVITMYFNDHEPPHFHVRYGEFRATFAIDALELLQGELPPRVVGLVAEWAALHRFELRRNWTLLATEGKFPPHRAIGVTRASLMMVWVTEARALPEFTLWLRFSDASEGKVDLREFIESDRRLIVRQLRDPAVFANLRVDADTVVWANGFDLAPEFLRARLNKDAAA